MKNKFSKHDLTVEENDLFNRYTMQMGYSPTNMVVFTIINGVTLVTGDYGNWVFDREFYPTPGDKISRSYATEKIRKSSTQKTHSFCSKTIVKKCNEIKKEWKQYVDKENKHELFEYLDNIIMYSDDEYECVTAIREEPDCFSDPFESFDLEGQMNLQLIYVFDVFDEICKRLAKPVKKWNDLTEIQPTKSCFIRVHAASWSCSSEPLKVWYDKETNLISHSSFDDRNKREYYQFWK